MTDLEKIKKRWAAVRALATEPPFEPPAVDYNGFTIEKHGDGEALYLGRSLHAHGLNIVHLTEPAYQWPTVRTALEMSLHDIEFLIAKVQKTDRRPTNWRDLNWNECRVPGCPYPDELNGICNRCAAESSGRPDGFILKQRMRTCTYCGKETRITTAGCDVCDVEDK